MEKGPLTSPVLTALVANEMPQSYLTLFVTFCHCLSLTSMRSWFKLQ